MAAEHDPKTDNEREFQPDPFLKEGRSTSAWAWTVGFIILAVAIVTFFAMNSGNSGMQMAQHDSRVTTGASNKPPETALPAGRSGSRSPKQGDYHTVR